MKTHLACLLVAACATIVVPDLAYACGTGAVLFADDFKTPDAGWVHNADGKIGSGTITLLPPVKKQTTAHHGSYLFSDADVCVDLKPNDFTKPEELSGGLLFWMIDANSYYFFHIYPSGIWQIDRRVGSRWIATNSCIGWSLQVFSAFC